MENQYYGTARLDPRCKLLMLVFVGLASYFINGNVTGLALILIFSLFTGLGSGAKWAVKMAVTYIVVSYLCALLVYVTIPGLSIIMSVFGVTVLKMIPVAMVGGWVFKTTFMDDLMVSLQRMRLPQSVIVSLTVMIRFIPTLSIEYKMIRSTMKIRGICDTFLKKLLHPIATLEYILIPLLMRCLKISDELAASGTTRGLEREEKRYSLNDIRFRVRDYAAVVITALILVLLIAIDTSSIGKIILWRV